MRQEIVCGTGWIPATLPDDTVLVPSGVSAGLPPEEDLDGVIRDALERPLDSPPLRARVAGGQRVTIAFDDATVPCYAPVWATALPQIVRELEAGGVRRDDISLVCANALHRRPTLDELECLIGKEVVDEFHDRLTSHDAEDPGRLVAVGRTQKGHPVEVDRCVVDSDLLVYLNCSTTRGFSGGWKSVCVGLSSYRSIHVHHTPDTMSMSLHRNEMHEILDEMGAVLEGAVGADRIFKLETVLANPAQVHTVYGGSVWATRRQTLDLLRSVQPARAELVDEPVDTVVYGVPDWSPYAAFSYGNPILDLISTGLGYLGGVIQAVGKAGCTAILATPCPLRWNERHHPSYPEVWHDVLPVTRDPDEARRAFEPVFAAREDLIHKYRHANAFHPVHAVMALYPLKRLRHAARVIVVGSEDPAVPRHCGFEVADSIEIAVEMAKETHGSSMRTGLVRYPPAFNRT